VAVLTGLRNGARAWRRVSSRVSKWRALTLQKKLDKWGRWTAGAENTSRQSRVTSRGYGWDMIK